MRSKEQKTVFGRERREGEEDEVEECLRHGS